MDIKERLTIIRNRIQEAAETYGRGPHSVRLVAVSKTKPADSVLDAIEAGATIFGENYIQEAQDKISTLAAHPVSWHFIGHLQTNKAKFAVKLFDLIHSVDSLKLARQLDREAEKHNKIQNVLIQVNVGKEASKSGVSSEDTVSLIEEISKLPNLSIRGLMTMPPFFDDPDRARPYFKELADLRHHIRSRNIPNVRMDELSMGMTGDFKVAIECGSTLVRIGTAIFGRRN